MSYQQLIPVAFAAMDTTERDLLPPIESLTIFNLDGNELQMFMNGTWRNVPLYMGERHDGDIMTWKEVAGHWVPSSDVNVIGQLTGSKVLINKDSTSAIEVRRTFSGLAKTGTGTGDILLFGDHTHTAAKSYRVTIDTAGDHDTATFKWSDDGGATFLGTLVPVSDNARTHLQNGVFVLFTQGTYVVDDRWDWTAIATGSQVYDLKVDTTNSTANVSKTLIIDEGELYSGKIRFGGTGYPAHITGRSSTDVLQGIVEGAYWEVVGTATGSLQPGVLTAPRLLLNAAATPTLITLGSGIGTVYMKSDFKPYWYDEVRGEQNLLATMNYGKSIASAAGACLQ